MVGGVYPTLAYDGLARGNHWRKALGRLKKANTLLGAAITFQEGLIYSAYQELPRPWEGFSYISDQRLGGLTLWVPGDMMCIIGAGIVMFMWYQREMEENPNPPMPVPMETNRDEDDSQ